MRIKLIKAGGTDAPQLTEQTHLLLQRILEQQVVLADENPDVVHVVGAWTPDARREAKLSASRHIPVVHTPLGALSPWNRPHSSDISLSNKALRLVASGAMEYELLDGESHEHTCIIPNPELTAQTDTDRFGQEYTETYSRCRAEMDDRLWTDADRQVELLNEPSEPIREICRRLIYADCLYQRHNIPLAFLKQLAEYMIGHDYDEDRMKSVLQLIHLSQFTARLETVMFRRQLITEGFLPLPMADDKTVAAMDGMITEYTEKTN